ncbi:hypothetical protein UNDYM_5398 [Undibacterium sp. YM2]|jgi:predicted lipoprotein with Yx(FWY)xxD motif|uniref:COG4315 family predicted lipoprotein n=1 Tax=Undibacterium sp. YM2 TaxID=2058625 RepID=UPI001331C980|nr:hypothetical protein [Undibacterium sp. YM2]BBB69651.1 hypothetical protein UNDYM_5398 [Undibacterium sp. YM2]
MKTRQICLALLTSATFIAGLAQAQSAPKVADGILVSDTGMTLYSFDKDVAGSGKSTCNGPCATNWPPVAVPAKLPSGKYSVVTRDDGSTQLAYDGKPLYLYAADKKAGERTGDNFKNVWHLVKE